MKGESEMTDTFTPKAGMICRTRDGQNVGPIDRGTDGSFFWHVVDGDNPAVFSDGVVMAWHKNGQWSKFHGDHRYDLIAEWSEPLPGLPISELGAKPGDTIRCVWAGDKAGCHFPVGIMFRLNADGKIGQDMEGVAANRWEIVKTFPWKTDLGWINVTLSPDKQPKGHKRARIKELEAQVAELIELGSTMLGLSELGGYPQTARQWREAVARIKP